jgi:hypothetical protein
MKSKGGKKDFLMVEIYLPLITSQTLVYWHPRILKTHFLRQQDENPLASKDRRVVSGVKKGSQLGIRTDATSLFAAEGI